MTMNNVDYVRFVFFICHLQQAKAFLEYLFPYDVKMSPQVQLVMR